MADVSVRRTAGPRGPRENDADPCAITLNERDVPSGVQPKLFTVPTVTDAQLDATHTELSRCCSRRGYAEHRADELIDGLTKVRH